uniref:probable G-protein coupled receptor 139 n=1 Tax=Pristiophorus japonicus TaxID=55135 RepID=UPI00398EE79E
MTAMEKLWDLVGSFDLVDVWRNLHPDSSAFTWFLCVTSRCKADQILCKVDLHQLLVTVIFIKEAYIKIFNFQMPEECLLEEYQKKFEKICDKTILWALLNVERIYYPLLAAVGVPVNLVTIMILSRGRCGLSKCVSRYLVAMAAADLLVVILDLISRQIPILYSTAFEFMWKSKVCNIHAILLYAVTDCSVWFTVAFTFDRCIAICCQKLKTKYCTEKTATVAIGTLSALFCVKNTFWYFMYGGMYQISNGSWFCFVTWEVSESLSWAVIEFLHYIITPFIPFVLILLLNTLTVRQVLVSSRARRRLRAHSSGEIPSDPEMENRRKSIILLFVISGNFILLWAVFLLYSVVERLYLLNFIPVYLPQYVQEIGFMLQLLSCCTNTCIYAVTQSKFREELKNVVKYPFTVIVKCIK